jgi:Zn-dependent protease with chaperone function
LEISLTTPALLFPAISLLLLAYTNRFLAIASIIRQLHAKYLQNKDGGLIEGQLKNLRTRLILIRVMQFFGVFSLFLCVLAMFFIYADFVKSGSLIFGVSLISLLISLFISLREIQLSTRALELELSDMELGSKFKF